VCLLILVGLLTVERVRLGQGVVPTTQRACILSAAMMSSYDHCKHFILDKGWIKHDNLYAHIWFVWPS